MCEVGLHTQYWINKLHQLSHLRDYAHKSDCYCIHNGCSSGCILFRLSGVCIYQIQHNCIDVWRELRAVKSHERNVMLDGRPPPISSSEKELTRTELSILAQLRSGFCRLLRSYKSRIKKDASLNVCADCGMAPHNVNHLFVCLAHPTTMIPSDLWSRPTYVVRELKLSRGLKGEQQQCREDCTTHTRTHRNHASPGPHTSSAVTLTLSQHTHMQHKQQYMHHSHRNNRTHNIGYYDNLTNRPRTTTGLLTPHKHTGPAVKVREISSYCKST